MRYDNLKLEKGMYAVSGKSFSRVLEEMDPSENYRGTELEGLDAFERQLKRFDIHVAGYKSDPVEKFFSTATSAALFPEFVKRAVENGTRSQEILNQIVASKTYIDSLDYRSITSMPEEEGRELKAVAEGAEIPATQIKTKESLVKLHKRGRMLVASYEALRFQKLDLFSVTLKQIGAQIAKQQLKDAVDVLVNGDGNDNAAKVLNISGESLTYDDLISLWGNFEDFEMNAMMADQGAMSKLLALEELKDPATGLNFQATGRLTTPLGAALYKSSVVPANHLIAFDKNCALEMVTAGEIAVEYDKLIDRQLERASITAISGFAKIFPDAVRVLKVTKA